MKSTPQRKGFIVVGTGTEVGKTIVTAGLFTALLKKGVRAFPYKPVQTGAIQMEGKWIAPDPMIYMSSLSEETYNVEDMYSYLFQPTSSPHWVEIEMHQTISENVILRRIDELEKTYDCTLVECAGGLFTPLNRDFLMIDLVEKSGFPVILVAPDELGSIHSVLSNLYALQTKEIPVFGVALTQRKSTAQTREREERSVQIARRSNVFNIVELPFLGRNVNIRTAAKHLTPWAEEIKAILQQ